MLLSRTHLEVTASCVATEDSFVDVGVHLLHQLVTAFLHRANLVPCQEIFDHQDAILLVLQNVFARNRKKVFFSILTVPTPPMCK